MFEANILTIKKERPMDRRKFSLTGIAFAGSIGRPSWVQAQAKEPVAGVDYLTLKKLAPVDARPGKIEIIEFFWYSCPHCNSFEPEMLEWLGQAPKDISFQRIPVAFRSDFVPQQKLFFALEAMGQLDSIHTKVFKAIHVQKLRLNQDAEIADWIAQQGLNKEKFLENFNSFSTNSKIVRATKLQNAYMVEGVPSFGVAGRYYTDGSLANGMSGALRAVDHLIKNVRQKKVV